VTGNLTEKRFLSSPVLSIVIRRTLHFYYTFNYFKFNLHDQTCFYNHKNIKGLKHMQ
jgi:hypothetical protein